MLVGLQEGRKVVNHGFFLFFLLSFPYVLLAGTLLAAPSVSWTTQSLVAFLNYSSYKKLSFERKPFFLRYTS